jgi:lysozyme
MAGLDDLELEDIAIIGGALVVAYMVWNSIRDSSATDQGGASFESQAPPQSIISKAIDIIDPMQVSPSGQAFIKQEEGLTLNVRSDAGNPSIGYGHTIQPGENIPNQITQAQADALFQNDIARAANAVNSAINQQVSQNQFDAMASLAFNIGAKAFAQSSVVQFVNAGDFEGAANAFNLWNRSQGRINQGLVDRRGAEQNLFNAA